MEDNINICKKDGQKRCRYPNEIKTGMTHGILLHNPQGEAFKPEDVPCTN